MKYKKVTKNRLEKMRAGTDVKDYVVNNCPHTDSIKVLKWLIKEDKLDWANWLIVRVMERKQYLAYSIYAAKQVLPIYEKKYPEDKRPRNAIKAAEKVLKNDTKENRTYAASAYVYAADAYAYAATATYAAYAATDVADAYAYAAYAATDAADAYAYATYAYATYAYTVTRKQMRLKTLKYGLKLLRS